MLLVVLGAGASYDFAPNVRPSSPQDPTTYVRRGHESDPLTFRPPLTDGLVADTPRTRDLLHRIPDRAADAVVGEIQRRMAGDPSLSLERTLDAITSPDEWGQREMLAFRFYLALLLEECSRKAVDEVTSTNQATLVRNLERWRRTRQPPMPVLYVTFNYDTLLEQAFLSVFGWHVKDFASYIRPDQFSLYKLHGSWDWKQLTQIRDQYGHHGASDDRPEWVQTLQKQLLDHAYDLESELVPEGFRVGGGGLGTYTHHLEGSGSGPESQVLAIPALAVPLASKASFMCPSLLRRDLAGKLPAVDQILAIGWKGGEPHFLEMLKAVKEGTQLTVVSPGETSATDLAERMISGGVPLSPAARWQSPSFSGFTRESLDSYLESLS